MKKTKIIEEIIKGQEQIIADLEKAVEVYRRGSDIDEEDTIDPDDLSRQSEAKDMQLGLENKLSKEKQVVKTLLNFKDKQVLTLQNGALVETDKMYIYVGVVTHPIEIGGKKLLSISQKAPIMNLLKDKKAGDTIKIGSLIHTIKSIL